MKELIKILSAFIWKYKLFSFTLLKIKEGISASEYIYLKKTSDKIKLNPHSKISNRNRIDNLSRYLFPIQVRENLLRVGGQKDGSYFIFPLTTEVGLLSGGVGRNIDFEASDIFKNMQIHLYDHTIEALPINIDGASWHKEKLGDDGTSLSQAISRLPEGDLFGKFDIEGSEWNLFTNIPEKMKTFTQIVIEFHNIFRLINPIEYAKMENCLRIIGETHQSVYVNANNFGEVRIIDNVLVPNFLEVTFIRKDLLLNKTIRENNPRFGDNRNNPFAFPISLQFPTSPE